MVQRGMWGALCTVTRRREARVAAGLGNCARALRFNACRTELPNAAALGAAGATYAVSAIR